jgi:hypothetical protein
MNPTGGFDPRYQLAFGDFGVEIREQGENDTRHLGAYLHDYHGVRVAVAETVMLMSPCPTVAVRY